MFRLIDARFQIPRTETYGLTFSLIYWLFTNTRFRLHSDSFSFYADFKHLTLDCGCLGRGRIDWRSHPNSHDIYWIIGVLIFFLDTNRSVSKVQWTPMKIKVQWTKRNKKSSLNTLVGQIGFRRLNEMNSAKASNSISFYADFKHLTLNCGCLGRGCIDWRFFQIPRTFAAAVCVFLCHLCP